MRMNQETVLVDNAFYIGVPKGFQATNNADKQFFCIEAGRPYFFVMNKGQRESTIPDIMYLSEEFIGIYQKIEHVIFNDCSDDFSAVSGLPTNNIINTKTLSVRYGAPVIVDEFASFNFCVIVPGILYSGVYRLNSGGHTVEEMEATAKTLLGAISPCDNTQDQEDQDDWLVKGIQTVKDSPVRITYDNTWTMEIPPGYSYCMDPEINAECASTGKPYRLLINQSAKKEQFSEKEYEGFVIRMYETKNRNKDYFEETLHGNGLFDGMKLDNVKYIYPDESIAIAYTVFAGLSYMFSVVTPGKSYRGQAIFDTVVNKKSEERLLLFLESIRSVEGGNDTSKTREPSFSEDGPMTCCIEQQDTDVDPGALEETDEIKMFVILTNDKKMGQGNRKPNDFFKAYGDYFAALKKKEMLTLREAVLSEMEEEEYCIRCRETFMKNSVDNRFIIATKSCFDVTELGDFSQKADEAIEKTIEWYTESEATEVRTLMNAELDRIKNQIDKKIKAVNPEWANWSTAKQNLKVFVHKKNDPHFEVLDDCKLFRSERRIPQIVIEVMLCSENHPHLKINVTDGMPLYWGVSYVDVWKAARKNEIDNKIDHLGDDYAKEAMSKIRKKYPDAALIKQRQKAAEREVTDAAATSSLLSELDTLCLYAIADYERNCSQKLSIYGIQNSYREENNCFRKLKKKQIEQAFREMEKTISDGRQETKEYEAGFRALSTDERFQYITQPVFKHYLNNPNAQQREKYLVDALTFTAKWYDSCELIYVEKRLNKLLQEYGEEIDKFFEEKDEGYMKDYHSLKKNLAIRLEHHIYKEDKFAQIDDGEYRCSVGTKLDFSGIFSVYYNNALPWYWGVSRADIWNNAFQNDVFVPWLSSLDETIIRNPAKARRIAEKYVKRASQDTYVPDNPYDRNKIFADIEPYEVVAENVKSKYGELTTDTIKMYLDARDADVQSEIERKAREEKTDKIKKQAHGFEKEGTINSLYKALELYRGIENDADVKNEIQTCEERIMAAKEELGKQKHYNEGKRLEKEETVSSIKKAAEQYELAEDYKDAANRAMKCRNHAKTLEDESRQELIELQNTLSKLKVQHTNLGGIFKKKQRLEVEENIRLCEQKIRDVKTILEG